MNDKTKRVMIGYLSLSDSERSEFEEELRRYRLRSFRERELYETEMRVTSGPVGNVCPCCGR